MIMEEAPLGSKGSNGDIERMVEEMEGQIRSLWLGGGRVFRGKCIRSSDTETEVVQVPSTAETGAGTVYADR